MGFSPLEGGAVKGWVKVTRAGDDSDNVPREVMEDVHPCLRWCGSCGVRSSEIVSGSIGDERPGCLGDSTLTAFVRHAHQFFKG